MASHRLFRAPSSTIARAFATLPASAAVRITLRLALVMSAVVVARYGVRAAIERHAASAKAGPVASGARQYAHTTPTETATAVKGTAPIAGKAMAKPKAEEPECKTCREPRLKAKQTPRRLIRLPTAITQSKEFKKPGRDVYVCEWCDGETLITTALRTHQARKKSK